MPFKRPAGEGSHRQYDQQSQTWSRKRSTKCSKKENKIRQSGCVYVITEVLNLVCVIDAEIFGSELKF